MWYVYILTNKRNGILYVGCTDDLVKRIWQHKEKVVEGFTKKHNITKLVYFEEHSSLYEALNRENNVKHWKRWWKLKLIEDTNPKWKDLYKEIF